MAASKIVNSTEHLDERELGEIEAYYARIGYSVRVNRSSRCCSLLLLDTRRRFRLRILMS